MCYEINAEPDCGLYVWMSVIGPIATVSRSVSCVWFIYISHTGAR